MGALCSGYTVPPVECEALAGGDERIAELLEEEGRSMHWGEIFLCSVIVLFTIVLVTTLCVKKCWARTFKRALQEEVMMEVQSAMADYKMMGEEEVLNVGDSAVKAHQQGRSMGKLPRW